MSLKRTLSIATAMLALCTSSSWAQDRYGPLAAEVVPSARALALGGAFLLGSIDSDALFFAPGSTASLRGLSTGVTWWGERATLVTLSAGVEWFGGAVGAGLQSLDYNSGSAGYGNPWAAERALRGGGAFGVAERIATLGYSRQIKGIGVGLAAKLVEQRIDGARAATGAVDVGVAYARSWYRLALTAQQLGPSADIADTVLVLPRRITLGAATRSFVVGPLDVSGAFALGYHEDGTLAPGGGVEVGYWPVVGRTFYGRVGARHTEADVFPLTFGGGFSGDRIAIDYVFQPYDGVRREDEAPGAHRITLRVR